MATFAVAALVVAVLFADRLIPPEELRRRFYQVGLGVTIARLAAAVAAVVVPAPETLSASIAFGPGDELGTGLLRERLSVVAGAALLLLLGSLYQSQTLPTLSLGVTFGALILLIGTVADSGSGGFINYYYDLSLDGGETRNAVYAGIIAIGVVLLAIYGFNEWDRAKEPEDEEAEA